MPSPTIRQIAKLAGVSRTTVSLALRRDPRLSKDTITKVLKVAQQHGYTPDPLVSTLMNHLRISREQRSVEKLAYLTFWPDSALAWRINVNETAYFDGACERAAQLGYEVEHFWAKDPTIRPARLSKILYTRGIRGVILAPLPRHLGHVSFQWPHFASAGVGITILKPGIHRASHAYGQGMTLALRNLKRLGYRRIGFANAALYDRRVNHAWLSAFLTYQYQIPAEHRIPPFFVKEGWGLSQFAKIIAKQGGLHPMPEKLHREEFARWLDQWKPDVLVSNTDHPYVLARDLGLRIPEDIGYAQLHRLNEDDPWAGVDRLPKRISAAAVDLVVGQLQSNEFGLPEHPKTVSIDGVWRNGPSLRGTIPLRGGS